ncbi:WEB family protein [Quillaja saponaria]|uniref:WEB family protein n=1 Tax=Quillaja saponaria TaxID=32244 RepID=A0AAD7KVH9_QUISA|nr:WEB family protein [Quillaja saponaria]
MEEPPQTLDFSSTVDTSRPFSSVKEAVAILGERLLVGEIYAPKSFTTPKQDQIITSWSFSSPSPLVKPKEDNDEQENNGGLFDTLKKLEAELEETKEELKLLKERESETEVALATLNAELHKNMSKMAEAEAAAAAKAVVVATKNNGGFDRGGGSVMVREEEKRREFRIRMEDSSPTTLAQILSIGEKMSYFEGKRERKMMKKKPIIPLVGDLFSRKKGSNTSDHRNPLYSSPYFYN